MGDPRRPPTPRLDTLVRDTLTRLERSPGQRGSDALLYLGSWQQAVPALLIQDPVLSPVDKVAWMVIRLHARPQATLFPSYADLARLAHVGSSATVARSLALLRALRWLSLCARVRRASGQFGGNVYALHDEPLALADALRLDASYLGFVRQAQEHHHARVRAVAAGVLDTLDEDIARGRDPAAPESPLERRVQAVQVVGEGLSRRYFSLSAAVLARLHNRSSGQAPAAAPQNSKPVDRVQNLKTARSGVVVNRSKTTTTRGSDPSAPARASEAPAQPEPEPLVYPCCLSANERDMAERYLGSVPEAARQAVLDELEGRMRSARHGAPPVYNPLGYLHSLCRAARTHRFEPAHGPRVQAERERAAAPATPAPGKGPPPVNEAACRARGQQAVADLRRALGVSAHPVAGAEKG